MSVRYAKTILFIVSLLLLFVRCNKNNSQDEAADELIPEEIIQMLDDCPTTNYSDITAFGFHYKDNSPLDRLFSAMCNQAIFLTKDIPYSDQIGLAYVNGYGIPESKTKDYTIARIGTWKEGIECACQEPLYGTDCSGFIAHVMRAAEIKGLFEMTAHQQVKCFKNLTELNSSLYKGKVMVEEIKNVGVADVKNGDIIYKTNGSKVTHIGILFKTTNGKIIMFQSSGSPSYSCDENRHEAGRGPIQKELSATNLNKYFGAGSGKAHVLRIIPDSYITVGNTTSHNLMVSAITGTSDGFTTISVEITSTRQPYLQIQIVGQKRGNSFIGKYLVNDNYDDEFCQIGYANSSDEYSGECNMGSFSISETNNGYKIFGEGVGGGTSISFYYEGSITLIHI